MIRITTQATERVKIDDATFIIRPLTGADVVCITCQHDAGMKIVETVKRGVVGWEGIQEADGHSAQFDGRIEGLPSTVIVKLSAAIWNLTHPSESDEKKSDSAQPSSPGV